MGTTTTVTHGMTAHRARNSAAIGTEAAVVEGATAAEATVGEATAETVDLTTKVP